MDISRSQQNILHQLKIHGAQSVKVLARRLAMTTMGVRQHLTNLKDSGLVSTTPETRQRRGRPLHLWDLTVDGHGYFPDGHREVSLELIDALRDTLGEGQLVTVVNARSRQIEQRYRESLSGIHDLHDRLQVLARLRSAEGYMAEVRLLPDHNWLLIENHCPISNAARRCEGFCASELALFRDLLGDQVQVERVDHLLAGQRRCAYRVIPVAAA